MRDQTNTPALILRSREAASRRMLQEAPDVSGPSFETRLSALLRMRALESLIEGTLP
jgi:hypothetical protein